jgi:hypothetical protein
MIKSIKIDTATKFVVLLGLISLFSDMTYEAARSINGSFLQLLGTNGATVGLVAGIGELFGYTFFSGNAISRSLCNLLSHPATT